MCNFLAAGAIVAGGCNLTLWQKYLGLDATDLSWLNALSANAGGAAIGAFFGGFLADRYGRRNLFTWNMLTLMVGIILSMTANNFVQLLTGFIVTGIAVGTSIPASWTYICECSGDNHRGRNIAISQVAWGLGPTFVLFCSYLLAPGGDLFDHVVYLADDFGVRANRTHEVNVFGSRIVFGILLLLAVISFFFMRRLEASREWLKNRETIEKEHSLFYSFKLLRTKKYGPTILILTAMYLSWNLTASAMGFFQGHIYETVGHLSTAMSSRALADMWLLTSLITLAGVFFLDKYKHRNLLVGFLSAGILTWFLAATVGIDDFIGIVIVTILWAIQAGVSVQLFFSLWTVELFPFKYRAAALGISFGLVRLFSAFGNYFFSINFSESTIRPGAIIMFILLCISAWLGWKFAPETRGKSMTQIIDEQHYDE